MTAAVLDLCGACGRPESPLRREMCHACYERNRRAGNTSPLVDPTPTISHVEQLRAMGLGTRTIAQLAGLDRSAVAKIAKGDPQRNINARTAAGILAIAVPEQRVCPEWAGDNYQRRVDAAKPCKCGCGRPAWARGLSNTCYQRQRKQLQKSGNWDGIICATGSARRLRALVAIGWPLRDLAVEYGGEARAIFERITSGRQTTVEAATARRIAELFDRLQLTPGPSELSRQRAFVKGWAPPLAWDEDDLDDPDAQPEGIAVLRKQRLTMSREEFVEIVAEHRELGHYDQEIAEALRVSLEAFRRRLGRAGITERSRGITGPPRNGHHAIRLPRQIARAFSA